MMQQLLYSLVVVVVAFSSLWNESVILMQITLGNRLFRSLIDVGIQNRPRISNLGNRRVDRLSIVRARDKIM